MPADYIGPPEITTSRLQSGPGPLPMTQAATAWTAKAAEYTAQAARYASIVGQAGAAWLSPSSAKMVASAATTATWLGTSAGLAGKAAAQAAAYTAAYTGVPQLEDIARNHVTHAVLESTNFLGINAAPIAANEADYFIRMTNQAAATMAAYEASSMSNLTALSTFSPPVPMTSPDVGVDALVSSGFLAAAGAPAALGRDAIFSAVGSDSILSTGFQQGGRFAATVGQFEGTARALGAAAGLGAQAGSNTTESTSDAGQQLAEVAPVIQSITEPIASVPGQLADSGSGPTQGLSPTELLSPLQQFMSANGGGYGLDSTGTPVDQIGMVGASPLSNHPSAGGTGAAVGAGLISSAAVPGAGKIPARTPLLAALTAASQPTPASAPASEVTAGPAAGRAGGAPVGAMPIGAAGRHRSGEGTVEGLLAPMPLSFDDEADNLDDWT